jgi:hypothetical protein
MSSIAPLHAPLVDESQIRLVHQRRRLKSVGWVFTAHGALCLTMQLVIDNLQQPLTGGRIARSPRREKRRDIVGGGTQRSIHPDGPS